MPLSKLLDQESKAVISSISNVSLKSIQEVQLLRLGDDAGFFLQMILNGSLEG